jgi:hypothetical protein
MIKYLILISTLGSFHNVVAQVATEVTVDSVIYSKNDAFFEYTVLDVFLGTDGIIYRHELGKGLIKTGNVLTQEGRLIKGPISQEQRNSLFEFINHEGFVSMKIEDPKIISDKATVTTKYYSKGKLVNVISDYGADGNESLVKLYDRFNNLIKVIEVSKPWVLDKKFDMVHWEQLDSIKIVEHDKSGENYYRNGVRKSVVLTGERMKEVISCLQQADQYVPYMQERYSVLTGRTDKYSLLFYLSDEVLIYNYDGKRIMKTSYLHYKTEKNIARKVLRTRGL